MGVVLILPKNTFCTQFLAQQKTKRTKACSLRCPNRRVFMLTLRPWDDIVRSMHERVKSIPRDPECLKYMLRLRLNVAGEDFHQHLKQVHLRPAILVLLLQELFQRKHEAFTGSFAAESMYMDLQKHKEGGSVHARTSEDLELAVHRHYPETEPDVPLADRRGSIPDGIREEIEEAQRTREEKISKKR